MTRSPASPPVSPPVSPRAAPLRCHLLIGPPASGKTTLAAVLAGLTGALVLSTDGLRAELFGDPAVQGPWREIEALLHQRIRDSVAAGIPVIVDSTHARRPWRLAITQALSLPAPVEWIGWWLYTPLSTCLQWNQIRKRLSEQRVLGSRRAFPSRQRLWPQYVTPLARTFRAALFGRKIFACSGYPNTRSVYRFAKVLFGSSSSRTARKSLNLGYRVANSSASR